jgi:hypothetical protein
MDVAFFAIQAKLLCCLEMIAAQESSLVRTFVKFGQNAAAQ